MVFPNRLTKSGTSSNAFQLRATADCFCNDQPLEILLSLLKKTSLSNSNRQVADSTEVSCAEADDVFPKARQRDNKLTAKLLRVQIRGISSLLYRAFSGQYIPRSFCWLPNSVVSLHPLNYTIWLMLFRKCVSAAIKKNKPITAKAST